MQLLLRNTSFCIIAVAALLWIFNVDFIPRLPGKPPLLPFLLLVLAVIFYRTSREV